MFYSYMKNNLISFVERFFQNIGATVLLQGDFLIVSNIPKSFEKFYGKKGPYNFVFNASSLTPDTELIEKGSYAMKTISNYLEDNGKTTLLKLNFNIQPEEKIKKNILLINCKIEKFIPKKRFNVFFKFTFHTTFQYLNENEKMINNIYVRDGEIIRGDLSDYNIEDGNKNEIKIPDIKEPYFIAKKNLKEKIKPKTEELTNILNTKLEKEIERIEAHFKKENNEFSEILKKSKARLLDLEILGDTEKIARQKKIIQRINEKVNFEELGKDKRRVIQMEEQKHSLNINNKLFNTTLIYYPLYTFNCTLRNSNIKRIVELDFDPLTGTTKDLSCESCASKTKEIFLCSNGHITCKNCSTICESCLKEYCKKCVKTKCEICSKNICKNCSVRCFRCGKVVCKTHTKKDKISGKIFCNNCLRRCERCGNLKNPYSFKKSKRTGAEICEDCFRKAKS